MMCYCTPNNRTPFCANCNQAMYDRINSLESKLRQAREVLFDANPDGDAWIKYHDTLAAIDAVLSGAPPSELSDERILEIAKEVNLKNEAMGFIWNQDLPVRYIQQFCVAFARAVLKEGRKG